MAGTGTWGGVSHLVAFWTPNIANQNIPLSLTDRLEGYKAGGHWWYRAKNYTGVEGYNFWKGNHDPAWDRLFNEVAGQQESILEKIGPGTWVVTPI